MTDYQTTTTRDERVVDPQVPPTTLGPTTVGAQRTTTTAYTPAGPDGASTAARVVTFAFGILQALLILRIVMLMLVANAGNAIVDAIFSITQPFVDPFIGMFALDRVTAGQSVLDVAAIVALIAWTLLEFVILAGLRMFSRRPVEAV
jgi:uncharacterized protein YggT (Ycf19 family)